MDHEQLRTTVRALMPRAREDLEALVAIPSVADPRLYPPERCIEAAEYVRDAIADAGLNDARLIDMPDGHPAVFGERRGPDGAPTVLLYCHYDVQPPLDDAAWDSPPFELTERDGRWYGRGSADCKGNIVLHLTALRALGDELPVGVKLIAEGAEEQGTGGIEQFVPRSADLLEADAIIVADAGNVALGVPTLTTTLRGVVSVTVTVRTLAGEIHSGMYGGAAPDALLAMIRMLATLTDERGDVTIAGVPANQAWQGAGYPEDRFRTDAGILPGVEVIGSGAVADMLWARPSVTVLGIDCPPIVGSLPSLQPCASARVSLRIPPGSDPAATLDHLAAHLRAVAPWGAEVEIDPDIPGAPFQAAVDGPAYAVMREAMHGAYGIEPASAGQGGSIPLCNVLAETLPRAEIMLLGVEEPGCLIHAPNESLDPSELESMALAEALFLVSYGATATA